MLLTTTLEGRRQLNAVPPDLHLMSKYNTLCTLPSTRCCPTLVQTLGLGGLGKRLPQIHAYLVGEEGDSAFLRSEDGDDLIDERGVGVLLQVGLKTDIGAPLLWRYMNCEVCVLLNVGRKETNKKSAMALSSRG